MPYITREDGERFVIPSYRDVLTAKQKSILKKEVLALSVNYGGYITMQRKAATRYEVAFSTEPGYLLGESIWQHFKRPTDMIYCEAIPNTTEAILVIVKEDSVYLDGSFPIDSIPEELIIFLTQQNDFEIYIYGDVPIAATVEPGKFSFEANSVKSFTELETPVFSTLPLLKAYQLQNVEQVLRAHGIGIFPLKQLVSILAVLGIIWFGYRYFSAEPAKLPEAIRPANPYATYNSALETTAPNVVIDEFINTMSQFYSIPGWVLVSAKYAANTVTAGVQSNGNKVENLLDWAAKNNIAVTIQPDGVYLTKNLSGQPRQTPTAIYPLNEVVARLIDELADVYPGNHLTLSQFAKKDAYMTAKITIKLDKISPVILSLIGSILKDMPYNLLTMEITIDQGSLSGNLILDALGS